MEWLEVHVATTTAGADIVAQALIDCGSSGASIEDRADVDAMQKPEGFWDMIDPSVFDRLGEGARVTGFFPGGPSQADSLRVLSARLAALRDMELGFDIGSLDISTGAVDDQDWANNWRKFYKPTHVGERFVVKPSWEEYEQKPGELIIHMDPGTAFGTGTHETTTMCLELAEKYVTPGQSIIDVGCGTAILAIGAVLLGAGSAVAVDIDPMAVDCANENVARNGMEGSITVRQGDLLSGTGERCGLMFANIVASVIAMLAPDVPARLERGGCLICSGIIREREGDVRAALEAQGMECVDVLRKGEWVGMCWRLK